MKQTILGLIVLIAFTSNAQNSHLFLSGSIARSENKTRHIADVGVAVKHNRFSLYTEDVVTQVWGKWNKSHPEDIHTGGYRKFFLGARYARVIPIKHIIDLAASIGADIRLNGGNTKATLSQGIYGRVANMPSIRTGMAIERPLSYNQCSVLSHIKLSVQAYSQANFKDNSGKKFRTGVGTGIILIF